MSDPMDEIKAGMLYDRDGNEISLRRYAELHELGWDYINVGEDSVGQVRISTKWLGANMNYIPSGLPLIFETMTFTRDGEAITCRRYPTLEAARAGHAETVAEMTGLAAAVDATTTSRGPRWLRRK